MQGVTIAPTIKWLFAFLVVAFGRIENRTGDPLLRRLELTYVRMYRVVYGWRTVPTILQGVRPAGPVGTHNNK